MTDASPQIETHPPACWGWASALFVAVLVLAVGTLIILGTRTDAYLNFERSMERFIGG